MRAAYIRRNLPRQAPLRCSILSPETVCWIFAPRRAENPHRLPPCWRGKACCGPTNPSVTARRFCFPTSSGSACAMPLFPAPIPKRFARVFRPGSIKCWLMRPAPGKACSGATIRPCVNGRPNLPLSVRSASASFSIRLQAACARAACWFIRLVRFPWRKTKKLFKHF